MSASDDSLHLTATDLRMATFRLARRLRCARAADMMSDTQLAVLADLRMNGRRTISTLAERERVTAPSMTSIVNGLEEQGYVARTPDEDDRRRVQVDITPAGVEIVVETIRRRDVLLADMLREVDYTEEELATLREASALMRRAVER
ncbi:MULTISPECIES: MarR family winged helix-turn-helix transcriptional regulator [Microbacterium]|jgi:DNA-binding MarR family transcriptional regulator|uniref:MarR family transcriptional regulator n=1 Tax=Microbacterium paraoxydans TaxID=199592 RepID=A0ABZ2HT83_9MICO|nr:MULTISPECIES: MarR family transcriptional regulator [Microbacterium]AMG82675.1 MarR family transcriptional regulator [Microbacterium sp. PAMC 28756]MPT16095.1 MarR family transcriptional regulator [Microbacterium sp.]OSP07601.1 MarR family transcriptional regulator [Microbacterium sp. LEMMJ01]QXE29576.1 MarR family transcriptional regulator [Microbacterium paraoxydans]RUQ03699.1 MarR family transcriptional regulator [Microbacterium sp. HSID17254]